MTDVNELYEPLLQLFDTLKKDDTYSRRIAYKPLYEFFARLIILVGHKCCDIKIESLNDQFGSLKPLWDRVKAFLALVDTDTKKWDELVGTIHNIRRDVEHSPTADPNLYLLEDIRKKAPEFRNWSIEAGKHYLKKSKHFTFKIAFFKIVDSTIDDANRLVSEFGETPYLAKIREEEEYTEIPVLIKRLRERERQEETSLREKTSLQEIKHTDLLDLTRLIELVSKFMGVETGLLANSVCPKCGGKIKDSTYQHSPKYDEPPTSFTYRVGCEKCDYELNNETIDI